MPARLKAWCPDLATVSLTEELAYCHDMPRCSEKHVVLGFAVTRLGLSMLAYALARMKGFEALGWLDERSFTYTYNLRATGVFAGEIELVHSSPEASTCE